MVKQWITVEDDSGDEIIFPYETEGTTMDAGRGFKWICLALFLWFVAILAMGWFVLKAIWGF
jgi:hypothetical protein